MSKWECIVCGWVYDESIGDPDSGIAPGTKWEDIPADWMCPDCGVGKEDFDMIEVTHVADVDGQPAAERAAGVAAPIIIIGTGLAGYGLAKEFRKHDNVTSLILISGDDGRSYSKPMLSTGYTKDTSVDELTHSNANEMARQLNASVRVRTKVTRIDTDKQTIELVSTEILEYSKLVLALGAETIKPPISGDGTEYVYSINDLADYDAFRKAVDNTAAKKICVIGGGLIGCEFTNDLINGGFETDTIDPLSYCLPTLLPEVAGKAVQGALEEKGARFHFGQLVTEVNKTNSGVSVLLSSGKTVDADLVICAVGVRPRIDLATQAGIVVNRGIVTDRYLATSTKNIYALGDCAEVDGLSLVYVAPLMAGAKALAKTLSDKPEKVEYPSMPVTIKTPVCPVVVSPPAKDAVGEWQIQADGHNVVAQYRDGSGNLLGFALTGLGTKEKMQLQKQLPALLTG